MKLFIKYLRYHIRVIAAFLLFSVIFAVVFILYKLPIEAVAYPVLLCTVIGLIFIFIDLKRVKNIHSQMKKLLKMTYSVINSFPSPQSISDEDYIVLTRKLKKDMSDFNYSAALRYDDMVDYYTVWAHQIKIPITSMQLRLKDEDSSLARRLSAELFHIEQYVEMVLAFLRLDSSDSDYVFKEYNLDEMITESVKRFSTEFIERKIRIEYEPLNKDIVTDKKWFAFVIEQLLSNALKYTPEGSIKIYLQGETLIIEDTGIGIAAEDLPRIFEKGYTGGNGRIDSKASGLGLYLCRRICKNLGIVISAESEVDKGTKIFLNLEQYRLKKE